MMQTDRRCCCEYPGFWREDWKRTAERQRQSWRQRVGDDDIWEIMVGNSQDGEGMEGVWRWGKPGGEREWDMAHTFASIGLAGAGVGNSGLGKKAGRVGHGTRVRAHRTAWLGVAEEEGSGGSKNIGGRL